MTVDREQASRGERARIDLVKSAFDAFAHRDLDALLPLMHPNARLWVVTAAVTREGHPYVGHDGMRDYFADVARLWQALEIVPIEFDEVGQSVVVLGEVRARGPAGRLRQPAAWTWRFRDDLVIDCRVDSDVRAAREALGQSITVEELVRGYVTALNRRDVDGMIALADPGIVNYPSVISRGARKYVGHQGLRNWMREILADYAGHTVAAREVRRVEGERWALLGELIVDDVPVGPFASLVGVARGLITEAREFSTEELMLSELPRLR